MATGVQVFKSTDSSAPALTGVTTTLVNILDACLVNGYGSKSPAGTGGAGAWGITYTATGKRVYRPSAGARLYLRVRDDVGGTALGKEAQVRSFETMSDIDTGTNGMPTSGQSSLTDSSLIVRKSADTLTSRAWVVLADDRTVMMFAATGDTANAYSAWYWGDFFSFLSGDSYRVLLVARPVENNASMAIGTSASPNDPMQNCELKASTVIGGHFVQRNRLAAAGPLAVSKSFLPVYTVVATVIELGNQTAANPNGPDGAFYLQPLLIGEVSGGHVRGRMRGFWTSMQNRTGFNDGDTFSGTGDMAGKTFLVIKTTGNAAGYYIVETSDTWEASS